MRLVLATILLSAAQVAFGAEQAGSPQTPLPAPALALLRHGDTHIAVGAEELQLSGPYRFVGVGGKVGYQPMSLKTRLMIPTDLHSRNEGSILLSICPLENLGVAARLSWYLNEDPNAQTYSLLTDTPVIHSRTSTKPPESIFWWIWQSRWHPQMIAAWGPRDSDFGQPPCVVVEHMPLREKHWYQMAITWNKSEHRLRSYVNGILCGTTDYAFRSEQPRPELYLGNTAMAFADLQLYTQELSAGQVGQAFHQTGIVPNAKVTEQLLDLFTVRPRAQVDWSPDAGWKLAYQTSFTKPGDLKGWTQQGCTTEKYKMKALEITPQGLLMQTPDKIDIESRMYLWSPENYEGDIAVQYDFRPEQNSGLALLVVDASGMQREDFIEDHPRRTTGSMSTIVTDRVRNYHWEFFRKVSDVRGDLGTHVLVKNPWCWPLGMTTTPSIEVNRWHSLLLVKEGDHIRTAIDGQWVFDLRDNPFNNNGPVFNYGRVGLRLMYQTRMRFRDMKIWTRDLGLEASE